MIFDTHIHLNDSIYAKDLDDLILQAREHRVGNFLVVGYDLKTSKRAIELSKKYPFIYACIGIHPSSSQELNDDIILEIKKMAIEEKVVAIGEIGLDYFHNQNRQQQKDFFIKQINIANQLNLPIIIHSRDSIEDTYQVIVNSPCNCQGILHCYSSSYEMALKFIKLGYYIGVGGALTFKNAVRLKEVVTQLPIEKIVVETDAPWLTPHPYRGQLNLPYYITYVVSEIARLKNLPYDQVVSITRFNAFSSLRIKDE